MNELLSALKILIQDIPNVKFVKITNNEIEIVGVDGSELFFEMPTSIVKWKFYSSSGWKTSGVESIIDDTKLIPIVKGIVEKFFKK